MDKKRWQDCISKYIRERREALGWSQERLAYQLGIDRSYVGKLERGESLPTLPFAERIAVTFGLSLSRMIKQIESLLTC